MSKNAAIGVAFISLVFFVGCASWGDSKGSGKNNVGRNDEKAVFLEWPDFDCDWKTLKSSDGYIMLILDKRFVMLSDEARDETLNKIIKRLDEEGFMEATIKLGTSVLGDQILREWKKD